MSWRPEGWDKSKFLDTRIEKLNGYDRTLCEAGADAMLEALRKQSKRKVWNIPKGKLRYSYFIFHKNRHF